MSGNRRTGTGLPPIGTVAHKQRIGERDNWICGICGWFIIPTESVYETDYAAVVDHIIPKVAGGTHEDDNLQITHYECNRLKGRQVNGQRYADYRQQQPPVEDQRKYTSGRWVRY